MKQYELTPAGIILFGAFNGLVKMSMQTSTPPNGLRFDEDDLLKLSEPLLTYKGAQMALSSMLHRGLAERARTI